MDPWLLAFAVKLPLALIVFLLIAYAGTIGQRIAGVLFTFPILNGVAIIASPDPVTVAAAIYPLVLFNCLLFAAVVTVPRVLPPVEALSGVTALFTRVIAWSIVWIAGAIVLTLFHDTLPGGGTLLAIATLLALIVMLTFWSGGLAEPATRPPLVAGFVSYWATPTGLARIAFFCAAYAVLVLVSRHALDEKWVGMASALPLPGFFALAMLIDRNAAVRPIRDTLFLGPLLVIPFNWVFSHVIADVLPAGSWLRYPLLFAMWAIAAMAVVLIVPRIAAMLDRRVGRP